MNEYSLLVNKKIIVGWDVDGTLITLDDKPRYEMINLLINLKALGCTIMVASGGGQDYAKHWVEKLGLEGYVDGVLCKTMLKDKECDIFFDDQLAELGRVNIRA